MGTIKGSKKSAETRRRMSEAKKGHKVSEETREKMRLAKQNVSAETRKKMSESHLGKKYKSKYKDGDIWYNEKQDRWLTKQNGEYILIKKSEYDKYNIDALKERIE